MTQRLRNARQMFNDRPFDGDGISVYASVGESVQYRKMRLTGCRRRSGRSGRSRQLWMKGQGGNHDIANGVTKTARIGTGSASPLVVDIPAEFASQELTLDLRRYKDNVENESTNFRTVALELDSNRDLVGTVAGSAELLDTEIRAGGNVAIRFRFKPDISGTQPDTFSAVRTAGPTSPSDVTVNYDAAQRIYEIIVPGLSDASAYTYKVTADTSGGLTTDLLAGITFTADATGPPAPTSGVATPW